MKTAAKRLLCATLCLALILAFAGCASPAATTAPTTSAAPAATTAGSTAAPATTTAALTKVKVILDYVPNTNHTGLYVAQDKGYFADAGLDVEIIQPGEGTVTTLIAAGQGEFGISYQEDVTFARTSSSPLPVVAIAALLQHNTSGFASEAGKNITSPKDYEGKTYAGWGSPAEEATIQAVMERANADFSKLTILQATETDFTSAIQSQVDLMWIYEGWDGVAAEMAGVKLNYQPVRDLDPALDFYTPIIISSEDYLAKNPEIAKRFLSAVAKGYSDCLSDPDGAAQILYKYAPENDLEMIKASQKVLNQYILEDGVPFGQMAAARWDNYTKFMLDNGIIATDMDSSKAFTNDYLPQA